MGDPALILHETHRPGVNHEEGFERNEDRLGMKRRERRMNEFLTFDLMYDITCLTAVVSLESVLWQRSGTAGVIADTIL